VIDKKTGTIKISDSIELGPKSEFENFVSLKLGEQKETRDFGNGFKWLDFKNVKVNREYFNISFCFKNKVLLEILIVFNDRPFDLDSNWDNWNEQEEIETLKMFRGWIKRHFNEQTKFNWGEVLASFDEKSQASSIIVRYSV
jgi:hypothetical protein